MTTAMIAVVILCSGFNVGVVVYFLLILYFLLSAFTLFEMIILAVKREEAEMG